MKHALQIAFRNMTPSAAIEEIIRERVEKLNLFCDRITSCRVTVEAPHRHHHKGSAFEVRIELGVPGREIVIHRALKRLDAAKPGDNAQKAPTLELKEHHCLSQYGAHKDLYVAIRDAFNAASRRLQDYVSRRDDAMKAEAIGIPT